MANAFIPFSRQLYEAFPSIMKHLPGRHNDIFSSYRHVTGFLKEELKRHKENFDPADPRDYIDAFLVEITEVRSYICHEISYMLLLFWKGLAIHVGSKREIKNNNSYIII